MSYRVLLVCMGNICRSPTAEGVFRYFIKINNLGNKVEVDSAGTHGYHVGEAPDSRTQRAAAARGYNLSQLRARKVARQDLDYFDLILAMDKSNLDNLKPRHGRRCFAGAYRRDKKEAGTGLIGYQ